MTNLDALKSLSAYPIQLRTIVEVANRRSISLNAEATHESLHSNEYRLAKADILLWLSIAPNVSQGGQSYSLSDEQRQRMRSEAQAIYEELEPKSNAGCATFGYKGDRL